MNAKERTKQHFNETAEHYNNSKDGKFVEPMYENLVKEISKSKSGKILDVVEMEICLKCFRMKNMN